MGHDFWDLFGDSEGGSGDPDEPQEQGPRDLDEKEVKVVGVFEHPEGALGGGATTFVLLQDNHGRKVPIWIGKYEAVAISMTIAGDEFDRPMTHDLARLIIDRLGATVERVIVDDLFQETFYAKLVLNQEDRQIEIDCRPSDAIAIALRAKAPIFVAEAVIASVETKL